MTDHTKPRVFQNDKAYGSVERLSSEVILLVMRGSMPADLAGPIAKALDEEMRAGENSFTFWDLEQLKNYDSQLRVDCVRALRDNWEKVRSITVLARSPLVRMGVSVANLALDNRIDAHATRESWQKRLDVALGKPTTRSAKGSP